jgi:hypothetical protein
LDLPDSLHISANIGRRQYLPGTDIWNVGVYFLPLAKIATKFKNPGQHDILMAMST